MQNEYIFVEHSHGEFEGTVYDNVILSDGLRTMKVKNETGQNHFDLKEGDKVKCSFNIVAGKADTARVTLTKITK